MDSVPHVPLEPVPPCERCGGPCDDPSAELTRAHCMWLGNRLDRMNAARPRGVPKPHELAPGIDESGYVESLQLDAFECGMPGWWTVTTEEELEAWIAQPE